MRHKRRGCAWKRVWRLTPGQAGQVPLEHAAALVQRIAAMPGLRLTGIYTFKGLINQGAPKQDNILAAKKRAMMAEAARSIRAAGVAIQDERGVFPDRAWL